MECDAMTIDEATVHSFYHRFEQSLKDAGFFPGVQKINVKLMVSGDPLLVSPKELVSPPIELEYTLLKYYAPKDQLEVIKALWNGSTIPPDIETRARQTLGISIFTSAGREEKDLGAGISFELVEHEDRVSFCVNYNLFPTAREDQRITGPLNAVFGTFREGTHYDPSQVLEAILAYVRTNCLRVV